MNANRKPCNSPDGFSLRWTAFQGAKKSTPKPKAVAKKPAPKSSAKAAPKKTPKSKGDRPCEHVCDWGAALIPSSSAGVKRERDEDDDSDDGDDSPLVKKKPKSAEKKPKTAEKKPTAAKRGVP